MGESPHPNIVQGALWPNGYSLQEDPPKKGKLSTSIYFSAESAGNLIQLTTSASAICCGWGFDSCAGVGNHATIILSWERFGTSSALEFRYFTIRIMQISNPVSKQASPPRHHPNPSIRKIQLVDFSKPKICVDASLPCVFRTSCCTVSKASSDDFNSQVSNHLGTEPSPPKFHPSPPTRKNSAAA